MKFFEATEPRLDHLAPETSGKASTTGPKWQFIEGETPAMARPRFLFVTENSHLYTLVISVLCLARCILGNGLFNLDGHT